MKRSQDSLSINLLIFQQHTLLLNKADEDQRDQECWLRKRQLLSPNYCQTIYSVLSFIEYSGSHLRGKNRFLDLHSVLFNICPKLLSKPLHLHLPFILISPHCHPLTPSFHVSQNLLPPDTSSLLLSVTTSWPHLCISGSQTTAALIAESGKRSFSK